MNTRKLFTYLCLVTALFSIGGMRKKEDPVAATAQTSAISLKQKVEETKDGVKGAPTPSMTFYGNQKILTDSPIGDGGEEEETAEAPAQEVFEGDDSWEIDSSIETEKNQESTEKAVEDEDSWWSEDESESPPPDTQSGSEF